VRTVDENGNDVWEWKNDGKKLVLELKREQWAKIIALLGYIEKVPGQVV